MFDIEKFYIDYNIEYATKGTKVSSGWIGIDCPFCGGDKYRLGFSTESQALTCWSCGGHGHLELVQTILQCSWSSAIEIRKSYEIAKGRYSEFSKPGATLPSPEICEWPTGAARLSERGKDYLTGRAFNPDKLKSTWRLRETGCLGDYKFRIIAPIIVDGKMVSYQGRDITGRSELKYKACPLEKEVLHHQHIVYGADLVEGDSCLIVEGIADAWRMGPGAISCFGISFTIPQVNFISSRWKKAFVLFDAEEQAQKQAYELSVLLNAKGMEVYQLELESGDPGEMNQNEADKLMKELFPYRRTT